MEKVRGIHIDTDNKCASPVTIDDDLDAYYKLLRCDTVEIVPRKIGRHIVNVICDESGLLIQDPIISAIDGNGEIMFVGNLFIAGLYDSEGNLTSLTDEEQKDILEKCRIIPTKVHSDGLIMVTGCEYDYQ